MIRWTFVFCLAAAPVAADPWRCRNKALEVVCGEGACRASDGHTPMDITLDGETLTICAYTGCWEGSAAVMAAGGKRVAVGADLRWSHSPEAAGESGALVIDPAAGTGAVMIAGFVNPLICEGSE